MPNGKSIAATIAAMSSADVDLLIDEAADIAINAGCLHIQKKINQTAGDVAGVVFSGTPGDELMNVLRENFRRYFETERLMSEE